MCLVTLKKVRVVKKNVSSGTMLLKKIVGFSAGNKK